MQKELTAEFEALKKKLEAIGTPAAAKCASKCASSIQILTEEWTEPKPKEAPKAEGKTPATK
jgi:hypothetical protein